MSITNTLERSFEIYAGMTIQKRALVDVRDALKPSARMSIYSQYIDKIWPTKPFEKSAVSVSSAMRHFYPYGDAGLYSMLARMGKPFAMRYTLEEFQGSTGDITDSDNQSASRYTNMRLSQLAMYLFADVEKNTISKWYESYTGKEEYPSVLPSKGFYNICNGSMGIATGLSASIPQFNLREVNEALIKLLWNEDIDPKELICIPDFCGGGLLLNESEVRETLLKGTGFSCKLRAVATFDSKDRCIIFTETPYGIYTGSITDQIVNIIRSDDNPGIENVWDQSTNEASIKVQISKTANPDKVIKYLYKNTFLQYHFPISLTMLDNGKTPKVFTWKEALQAHLNHEKVVYEHGYHYDLDKINARLPVVEGLIKAIGCIEEVIRIVRESSDSKTASLALQKELGFTEAQAKAILDIKLSRLAHMEVDKLLSEQKSLTDEKNRIEAILADENLFKKEIEKGFVEVMEKFGDARRTKILNVESESDEPTEIRQLLLTTTNFGNAYVTEQSSLYTQKRGGVGAKLKMAAGEYLTDSVICDTTDEIVFFTQYGNCYHYSAANLPIGEVLNINSLLNIPDKELVCKSIAYNKENANKNLTFITSSGIMKKSKVEEYNFKRSGALKAIELGAGDSIISVLVTGKEKVGILTQNGNFLICSTEDVRPLGRVARGVKGITLNTDDTVVAAHLIPETTTQIASISGNGLIKRSELSEFPLNNRAAKGGKIQKLTEADFMADFIPISNEKEILVIATRSQIKLSLNEVPLLGKNTQGVKAIKLSAKDNIIQLSQI